MYLFVLLFLAFTIVSGVAGLVLGLRRLNFGEASNGQERLLRIVVISFLEILVGAFCLVAVSTGFATPVVALIVAIGTVLLAQLTFRPGTR